MPAGSGGSSSDPQTSVGGQGPGEAGASTGGVGGVAGMPSGGGGSAAEPDGLLAFGPPGVDADQMCGYCHGPNGEGSNLAPEIQHPVEDYATWVIRNGRMGHPDYENDMPAYGPDVLSDELLQQIFAFLQDFPEPTTAEGLFLDHCANCHGADGKGGVTMRDITREGVQQVISKVRMGSHDGDFGNRREYMHPYTTGQLSDEQVQMLADYVQTL
jgi:mono/diheme cytochrome c family protein